MKKRFLQMVKKRVLSLRLFPLLVCLGFLIPAVGWGQEGTPKGSWADNAASAFAGGTGTEKDPYQIATAEQLAKLSKDVSEGTSYQGNYFILTENIDLSTYRWVPIGIYKWMSNGTSIEKSFRGYLDGSNKTISGMVVDERGDQNSAGFFGSIRNGQEGNIVGAKDLTISGATVYLSEDGLMECSGGILGGDIIGNENSMVVFENIRVSGFVEVNSTNGFNKIGGMLGYASWVKAINCHAENVSISGASNSGGFVGNDNGSVFENCTASGTVSGKWVLGGFVGYTTGTVSNKAVGVSTYTYCSADVDVSGNDWRLGGFVGHAEYGEFNNCVAYGDVTSSVTGWNPKIGGFIGESGDQENNPDGYANATNCHAAGTITSASSDYEAGGFVGTYSGGTLTGCSFDKEKNPGLNAAGEGALQEGGVTGEDSSTILANICEDYYDGHQLTQKTEAKDPTCTEPGNIEYWTCERCGKHFSDENATEEITEEETIIEATGHSYGEPVWSWSEDGKTCMVTFTCANDETHTEIPEVTVTSEIKTPATCTETGVTTYTATVEFNGQTYTDTKDVTDIQATGHSYGEPEWSWSEDGKTCMVTFTCANDETHTESPEVTVTSEIKTSATCTETGVTTYTATVEFNGQTYTDTKDVADIPATGHHYVNGTCTECGQRDPDYRPDPDPIYYNIYLDDVCEGVEASLSRGVVKEGNQVSVYVEVEEGYDAENLKVSFKRSLYGYWEEVEEGVQPGEYIIYNVYSDIYVKVEGAEKIEEPTGMEDIEGAKVYAQDGNLYVYTSQPQEVTIITMNGAIVKRERQEGWRSYSLPKGIYIIGIGEERMKIRN